MVKTLWPILISLVLTLGLLLFTRSYLSYNGAVNDLSAWGIFFSVFGVLYAILVGFLLIGFLERFNNLSQNLEEELNALEDVRDFTLYLNGQKGVVISIKTALLKYIQSVVDQEWQEMADLSRPTDSDTSPELYEIMEAVHKVKVTNESDEVALETLISKIADITTFRTKRITLADQQLPTRLHLLMVLMSFIIVFGFVLMAVTNFWIHLLMTFSVLVSIQLVYIVLMDLNHPFFGVWNVSKEHFETLKKKLATSLTEEISS